jgi:glutathione S-transferase
LEENQFTMGDIPIGMRVHRWFLFDPEPPNLPNLIRWYAVIRQWPAFLEYIADPAVHLPG